MSFKYFKTNLKFDSIICALTSCDRRPLNTDLSDFRFLHRSNKIQKKFHREFFYYSLKSYGIFFFFIFDRTKFHVFVIFHAPQVFVSGFQSLRKSLGPRVFGAGKRRERRRSRSLQTKRGTGPPLKQYAFRRPDETSIIGFPRPFRPTVSASRKPITFFAVRNHQNAFLVCAYLPLGRIN